MIRQLPTIYFEGTRFYIDLRLEEFRQADCPFNSISFDNLVEQDDGYLLFYDTVAKNMFKGNSFPQNDEKTLKVIPIPPLAELDPDGFETLISNFFS